MLTIMPKLVAFTGLVALAVLLNAAEPPKPAVGKASAGSAVQGKVEYQNQCAGCHDGGAAGPVLKGLFQRKKMKNIKHSPLTEAAIRSRITGGGEGMPPFVSLKTKQLDDLIAYLKTL